MNDRRRLALNSRITLAVSCFLVLLLGTPIARSRDVEDVFDDANVGMDNALEQVRTNLEEVRVLRANADLLSTVTVDQNGIATPLAEMGDLLAPDSRTITFKPWDAGKLTAAEEAIGNANLGVTQQNNGTLITIKIPTLTEERRNELVKNAKGIAEAGRVAVGNIRNLANDELKYLRQNGGISMDQERMGQARIQALTDSTIQKIDELMSKKEKDIRTV